MGRASAAEADKRTVRQSSILQTDAGGSVLSCFIDTAAGVTPLIGSLIREHPSVQYEENILSLFISFDKSYGSLQFIA